MLKPALAAAALFCSSLPLQAQQPDLLTLYKTIHSHPELSHNEVQTSALLATELRRSGYTVTEHVGRYPDGTQAFGVVGLLKNGPGPTLLIRADMDALPITEETGLPYASHVTGKNQAGQPTGIMHACGHDIHTTVLIGTARALASSKANWHGTLMLVGQPSEETVDGARALLADHLFERFGTPTMVIGLHDTSEHAAGTVGITPGPASSGATSVDITIHGAGGHGARPYEGRDPIVLAALLVLQLQTIVSREQDPRDAAVVTVGTVHGGTKRNIIPDDVKLELTTRYFSDRSRQVTLDGIRNMAAALSLSAGLPPEKAATVTILDAESTPVLVNDPTQAARVRTALVTALGPTNVFDDPKRMSSEDVGAYGIAAHVPTTYFWLGAMDPTKFAAAQASGKPLPATHTSRFEPLPTPTLATGVRALTAAATALLQ